MQNHPFSKSVNIEDLTRRGLTSAAQTTKIFVGNGKKGGSKKKSCRGEEKNREISQRWQAWNSYGSFRFSRERNLQVARCAKMSAARKFNRRNLTENILDREDKLDESEEGKGGADPWTNLYAKET